MYRSTNLIQILLATLMVLWAVLSSGAPADQSEGDEPLRGERLMAVKLEAEVLSLNRDTRELVLRLQSGEVRTTVVDPGVKRLDEVVPGDFVVVSYIAALIGEVRDPTEDEIARPWVEGAAEDIAGVDTPPGAAAVTAVRAVCTIEGLNRALGTVTVLDARGMLHVVGDVTRDRFERLRIGQTVVMTFTRAMAIGVEKVMI